MLVLGYILIIAQGAKNLFFLSGLNTSVNYKKIINLKADIAKAVKEKIHENNEVFVPPGFAKNNVTYFAVDDIDTWWYWYTPGGK